MGRSKKRQTGAAYGDETGNRKRPRSIQGKAPNMVELSVEQLLYITNTVTQNVLSQLQQTKLTYSTVKAGHSNVHVAELHSPDQQLSLQVSEASTAEDNPHKQTKSVIPNMIAKALNPVILAMSLFVKAFY